MILIVSPTALEVGNGVPCATLVGVAGVAAQVESLLVVPEQLGSVFRSIVDVGCNLKRTVGTAVGVAHVDVAVVLCCRSGYSGIVGYL